MIPRAYNFLNDHSSLICNLFSIVSKIQKQSVVLICWLHYFYTNHNNLPLLQYVIYLFRYHKFSPPLVVSPIPSNFCSKKEDRLRSSSITYQFLQSSYNIQVILTLIYYSIYGYSLSYFIYFIKYQIFFQYQDFISLTF